MQYCWTNFKYRKKRTNNKIRTLSAEVRYRILHTSKMGEMGANVSANVKISSKLFQFLYCLWKICLLNHFTALVSFYIPWKHQKHLGFLFSVFRVYRTVTPDWKISNSLFKISKKLWPVLIILNKTHALPKYEQSITFLSYYS